VFYGGNKGDEPMRYEDTIMPETSCCDSCGVRMDEGDNYGTGDEWLCEDCHDERADDDCDDSDEPLTLSPRTDWLAIAADITGAAK
jgi:hypothetical protein